MDNKTQAAEMVNAGLLRLEARVDEALKEFGEFVALLPEARKEANLSIISGHEAFELLMPIGSALITARGAAVDIHNKLEAVRRVHRITMSPSGGDKPNKDFAIAARPLAVVA